MMMNTSRTAIFACLSLLICAQHLAGQRSGIKNQQALGVLQRSLASMNASTVIQDTIAQGNATFSDGTSPVVTIKTRGTNQIRYVLDYGSSSITTVINNGDGYRIENGVKTALPLHTTLYERVEYLPALSRAADYLDSRTNLSYLGLETLGSTQVHHIEITTLSNSNSPTDAQAEALNSEFHVFIDSSTNLVAMTRSFLFSPLAIENRLAIDTMYSDYRLIQGVMVPFHIIRLYQGNVYSDLQLTAVQIGVGLNSVTDFQ
jgi:hypothetical protein